MLFPYACGCGAKGAPLVPEGSPLLPNLSKANMHEYLIDIMVRLAVHLVRGIEAALIERVSR